MVLYAKNNTYAGQGKFADLVIESQGNQIQNFSMNPEYELHSEWVKSV